MTRELPKFETVLLAMTTPSSGSRTMAKLWVKELRSAVREDLEAAAGTGWQSLNEETLDRVAAREHPSMVILGHWPEHCEQRAFVDGVVWQMWRTNGYTPFGSERDEMEAEAVRRYGNPPSTISE